MNRIIKPVTGAVTCPGSAFKSVHLNISKQRRVNKIWGMCAWTWTVHLSKSFRQDPELWVWDLWLVIITVYRSSTHPPTTLSLLWLWEITCYSRHGERYGTNFTLRRLWEKNVFFKTWQGWLEMISWSWQQSSQTTCASLWGMLCRM